MVEMTEDYTRLDWDKPHFLDGSFNCDWSTCDKKAACLLVGEDGKPFNSFFCRRHGRHLVKTYRVKGSEECIIDEGILYKDPTSSNVLRGFPKEAT